MKRGLLKEKAWGMLFLSIILVFTILSGNISNAQSRDRDQVEEQYKWNLADMYSSDDAWNASKEALVLEAEKIVQFKGKLSSASELLACLQLVTKISKEASTLYSYASMKSDQDTRISENLAMTQELEQIFTEFNSSASFVDPEILQMDLETIDRFIEEEPELEVYRFGLHDLFREKEHTLSEPEEKILAEAGLMSGNSASTYNVFSNAELPYPEIELGDGNTVKLDAAGYSLYRASTNREDRQKVFEAFFGKLSEFKGSLGDLLYGNVKRDIFYARTRKYDSALESALSGNNIPTDVYHSLIDNVNKNLPVFHRYLEIKRRMLGVDELNYFDLYAPTVEGVDLDYTYDEGKELILDALSPLGNDYVSVVDQAFDERWIDVYPNPGKRSGAYSNGSAYDAHPYILLNYNGKYDDVSTLAHELGHTMHSYYSNKTQPYPLADYSIFVAEVASTFNEALLMDKMLKEIDDDDVRLSLLMSYLDNFKGTLFRQTQFAEYELGIHEKAEAGEPLTGEVLSNIYEEIVKKYYGHDQGVCNVNDYIAYEWAYIPHFYYNFYVYQYSTSFTASVALAEKVLNNESGALEDYIGFISAGGSDYPIEVLKKAGVDMTTSEPFEKAMEAMNKIMDEIETILDSKGIR